MNESFCQSCGMPLQSAKDHGSNMDSSINEDYCHYCYEKGAFTQNVTMKEMINISLKHMNEMFKNNADYDEQSALENMNSFFPKLKRWK